MSKTLNKSIGYCFNYIDDLIDTAKKGKIRPKQVQLGVICRREREELKNERTDIHPAKGT